MEYIRPTHFYTRLLSWRSGDLAAEGNPKKSIKWIDGLRGIASFLIVLTHLTRAWDYDLFAPRDDEGLPPRILQWPIVRILWQGRIGVPIFAFLTGFVCSLGPLNDSRGGDSLAAFTSVGRSALRRPSRLILPATIALMISWLMAQIGAFTVAKRSDSWWCRDTSPTLENSFWKEVIRLAGNFVSTWTMGHMEYDDQQWVLLPLLETSMLVYLLLCATMLVRFRWRLAIYLGMFLYFYQDATNGTFRMQAIYGMFLSDLSYEAFFQEFLERHILGRRVTTAILACSGLFITSYPEVHPEWSTWSNYMFKMGQYLFSPEADIANRYSTIGVNLIILAIYISPSIKDVLSIRPLLWLGKQSFAVYLLHGTLLRTVLCWMLYGISGQPWSGEIVDEKGNPILDHDGKPMHPHWIPLQSPWVVTFSIPIWISLLYLCAWLWTTYLDPQLARITQKLAALMFQDEDEKPVALPLDTIPMPTI